jgi:hypothetical protein
MACCAALEAGKPITNYNAVPVGPLSKAQLFDNPKNRAMLQPLPTFNTEEKEEESDPFSREERKLGEHEVFRFYWGWGGG